jgi:hypothetical protein
METDIENRAWSLIPEHMRSGLRLYIEEGIPPGDFLYAVLTNNLRETVIRADEINRANIVNWVKFLRSHAPSECWGSVERYNAWIESGGLNRSRPRRASS